MTAPRPWLRLQMGGFPALARARAFSLIGRMTSSLGQRLAWARRFNRALAVAICAMALGACDELAAPTQRGVCWRLSEATAQKSSFQRVSSHVWSLDDCAAQLEAFHLQGAPRVEGAFQGYFIFVDDRLVTSAPSQNGFRYPIFQPSQRREIDADLRRLIKDRGGALPQAGDISVERK
jgi:hypothetical protein